VAQGQDGSYHPVELHAVEKKADIASEPDEILIVEGEADEQDVPRHHCRLNHACQRSP
jgi:hypothetical protein